MHAYIYMCVDVCADHPENMRGHIYRYKNSKQKWSKMVHVHMYTHACACTISRNIYMRVVYTPGIPYLYMSFSAKEPYN